MQGLKTTMSALSQLVKKYSRYIIYASSISIGRLSEYGVLFFAAYYLSKEDYGQLEFYKKAIELLSVGVAFGLPSFLFSYTKNSQNRIYLTLLSFGFIFFFSMSLLPVFSVFQIEQLLIPAFFHAAFFTNGVLPVFIITHFGSKKASLYKTISTVIFNGVVFILILFTQNPAHAFIYVNYFLLVPSLVLLWLIFRNSNIVWNKTRKYFTLFKKQLLNSLTLVISNFSNMMFLYADIMLLKLLSNNPNIEIANYSFALNITTMLMLVPFTFVQVDIERIKKVNAITDRAKKIFMATVLLMVVITLVYIVLINTYYTSYSSTLYIFGILLVAKLFQSQSVLYGAVILIKRKFKLNLNVNLSMLIFNIILSYTLYFYLGILGLAIASLISLVVRYIILQQLSKKLF